MKKNIAGQLGFWSSVYLVVLGGVYLLVLVFFFAIEGFNSLPTPFVQLAAGILTFITVPGVVIQFTAIRFANEGSNRILGSLGVGFTLLFAATVSINRFVQLTVIQHSLPNVPADLARFLPYGEGSVMLALELLGWGFFSSLAALSVAALFSSSRLNIAIRWLFVVYAIFSFMSVIGFATNTPLTAGGFIAWGPIMTALSVLLAIYFRKLNKQVT